MPVPPLTAGPLTAGPVPAFDRDGLKTFPLATRPSKESVEEFGVPLPADDAMLRWLDSLPKRLAAGSLRRLCHHLVRTFEQNRTASVAIGGHVVKTGCGPYLIDLMRRGVLKSLHMNGAAAIHDAEIALVGKTSEDVAPRLLDGSFGMAKDTADVYAHAARVGADREVGLGRALGHRLLELDAPHAESSVVAEAYRLDMPCTVHAALGTDVVHMHPQLSGADLGKASMIDFRILTGVVAGLADGLWINLGCAVVMPEVFLKAVSIVRNFGHSLDGLVTANLDMIQSYRGRTNVCERPGDEGILLTGHHEIMVPLCHAIVVAKLAELAERKSRAA